MLLVLGCTASAVSRIHLQVCSTFVGFDVTHGCRWLAADKSVRQSSNQLHLAQVAAGLEHQFHVFIASSMWVVPLAPLLQVHVSTHEVQQVVFYGNFLLLALSELPFGSLLVPWGTGKYVHTRKVDSLSYLCCMCVSTQYQPKR